MDDINKAFMLELSYRLTVAVNMSEHRLATLGWMSSWNDDTLACARGWKKHLLASVVSNDQTGIMVGQIVNGIVDNLSRGYMSIFEHARPQDRQDVHVYQCLLDEAHKLAHASVFADWGLSEFFVFGQQLAQNDLRAHFTVIGQPELRVTVSSEPKFEPLSETSIPRSWPNWPTGPVFNDPLARYAANRWRFADTASFSVGVLTRLALSIACPSHFQSTVWCWEDWEGNKPWRLYFAGRLFPSPALVTVKDVNDRAFVILLEAMKRDKEAGRAPARCGWVTRNTLWPDMTSSDTRSKAWRKLTTKTLAALGAFESKGGAGMNKDTGAPCRLPAKLVEPDCRIFLEGQK